MAHRKEGHIEITHGDTAAFTLHTPKSLSKLISDLVAAEGSYSKTRYKELKTLVGFDVSKAGIWGNPTLINDLRLPDTLCFDWVHSMLQDGCFSKAFAEYMTALPAESGQRLRNFVDGWQWGDSRNQQACNKLLITAEGGSYTGHDRPNATELDGHVQCPLMLDTIGG